MSKVFRRPMFRKGGGVNMNGIMSGIQDRENYQEGTPSARQRYEEIVQKYAQPAIDPVSQLLIQGGLKGLSQTGGGGTLANLAMAFEQPTSQLFQNLQRQKNLQREAELAGLEMDISEEERQRRIAREKEATEATQKFQRELLGEKQEFTRTESELDRQLKRDLALAKEEDNVFVKTAKVILGANASPEEIGNMASKIATEKTFGVDERAKQSAIQKQKEAIEERFGLTEGLLENYYNFTSTGRAAELSEKTGKTFIGPIKKRKGRYKTKGKFGLYFDPVDNVAVEVNADGTFNIY
jgi:hypothetical protein